MIYTLPTPADDIRQGDIFVKLPRIDFSLSNLVVLGDEVDVQLDWLAAVGASLAPLTIAVAARPVMAIVVTQDCDTLRASQITLCEIRPLADVIGDIGQSLSKRVTNIPQQSKKNLKWFYLPPDTGARVSERMAVDFQVTLSVSRTDLERLKGMRTARLNPEADEHFRERLSEFYRRYPVDEWYPFDREEFAEYKKTHIGAEPRTYQI